MLSCKKEDRLAERIAEKVADKLEERGFVVPARLPEDELVESTQLAKEEGLSHTTIQRRITRWELTRRNEDSYPKERKGHDLRVPHSLRDGRAHLDSHRAAGSWILRG